MTFRRVALALVIPAATCPSLMPVASAQTSAPALKAGMWETVRITDTPPAGQTTATGRVCIAASQGTAALVPRQRFAGVTCENREVRTSAAGTAWRIVCTGADGSATGTGTLAVTAASYTGSGQIDRRVRGAKPDKLTQTYSGKWIAASCS